MVKEPLIQVPRRGPFANQILKHFKYKRSRTTSPIIEQVSDGVDAWMILRLARILILAFVFCSSSAFANSTNLANPQVIG